MLTLKKDFLYFISFFIFFFVSYHITVYGYFISKYIVLAICLFAILLMFLLNFKTKIYKNNILYSVIFLIIIFIYFFNNKELNDDIFAGTWFFCCFAMFFVLQFSKDWVNSVTKAIKIFTLEHAFFTILFYIFRDFYKNNILTMFAGQDSYQDLLNQYNGNMQAGFTGNYGINATYLVIGFLVYFAEFLNKEKKSKKDYFILIFLLGVLLITGKRGTFIFGIISAIVVYFLVNKEKTDKKIFKFITFSTAALVIFLIAANYIPELMTIVDRILDTEDVLNGRGVLYQYALKLFNDNPIFGIGWGNFKYYYVSYYNAAQALNVHNVYLQLLCEIGIVGFIFIMSIMIGTLIYTFKLLNNKTISANYKTILTVSFTIQVYTLLISLTSTPIYGVEVLYPYMVMCAIPYAIKFNRERKGSYEK